MREATNLIYTSEINKIIQFIFNYFIINRINDINLCEDNDHVNYIFRKGPQTIHVVHAGDLLPAGTMLVNTGSWLSFSYARVHNKLSQFVHDNKILIILLFKSVKQQRHSV